MIEWRAGNVLNATLSLNLKSGTQAVCSYAVTLDLVLSGLRTKQWTWLGFPTESSIDETKEWAAGNVLNSILLFS